MESIDGNCFVVRNWIMQKCFIFHYNDAAISYGCYKYRYVILKNTYVILLLLLLSQDKLVSSYHGSSAELVKGVEPGTLRVRVDVIIHYTTLPQLVDYMSPGCSISRVIVQILISKERIMNTLHYFANNFECFKLVVSRTSQVSEWEWFHRTHLDFSCCWWSSWTTLQHQAIIIIIQTDKSTNKQHSLWNFTWYANSITELFKMLDRCQHAWKRKQKTS